jgi:hypothetical protein
MGVNHWMVKRRRAKYQENYLELEISAGLLSKSIKRSERDSPDSFHGLSINLVKHL